MKSRILLFFTFIILIINQLFSQPTSPATNEKCFPLDSLQPILYDFYTNWCSPCKQMDLTTLKDSNIAFLIKTKFNFQKIDAESENGKVISKKYEVYAYPTFIIFDPNSGYLDQIIGFQDKMGFEAFLGKYLNQSKLPIKGKESTLKSYLIELSQKGVLDSLKFDEYAKTVQTEDWIKDPQNFNLLISNVKTCEAPYFLIIFDKSNDLRAIPQELKSSLTSAYKIGINTCKEKAILTRDQTLFEKILNFENQRISLLNKSQVIFDYKEEFYRKTKNDSSYKSIVLNYCDSLSHLDSSKIIKVLKDEFNYMKSYSNSEDITYFNRKIMEENYIIMYLSEAQKNASLEINHFSKYFLKRNYLNKKEIDYFIQYLEKAYQLYPYSELYLNAAKFYFLNYGRENNPFIEKLEKDPKFHQLLPQYLNFINGK